eukprot:g46623.t1
MTDITTRQAQLEEELKTIEKQIWDLEAAYIEDTNQYGNVIKGWDGYMNTKPIRKQGHTRKMKIPLKDRIFSQSSTTVAELAKDEEEEDGGGGLAERAGLRDRRASRKDASYVYTDDSEDEELE